MLNVTQILEQYESSWLKVESFRIDGLLFYRYGLAREEIKYTFHLGDNKTLTQLNFGIETVTPNAMAFGNFDTNTLTLLAFDIEFALCQLGISVRQPISFGHIADLAVRSIRSPFYLQLWDRSLFPAKHTVEEVQIFPTF